MPNNDKREIRGYGANQREKRKDGMWRTDSEEDNGGRGWTTQEITDEEVRVIALNHVALEDMRISIKNAINVRERHPLMPTDPRIDWNMSCYLDQLESIVFDIEEEQRVQVETYGGFEAWRSRMSGKCWIGKTS